MKIVTAYACEFCIPQKRKVYLTKKSAINHEKTCFGNPINRACATCSLGFEDCIYRAIATTKNGQGLRSDCPMWRVVGWML